MALFSDYEASVVTGFCGNALNREALMRPDRAWFDRQWQNGAARSLFFLGDRPILDVSGATPRAEFDNGWFEAFKADRDATVFLGMNGDAPLFAALAGIGEEAVEAAGPLKLIDLRSLALQGVMTPDQLGALAQGRSLLHWHARHGYCANCGTRTTLAECGYRRDCPACDVKHFPRTDPVAIWLTVDGDRCLLGRSGRFAQTMYSCLAGFIEPGETIENAVRRENSEESGVRIGRVAYHASQPWPFPASLMIGCYAEALTSEIVMDDAELVDCRWFPRKEVAAMKAGSHPDGLTIPPNISIAYRLISDWLEPPQA